MKLAIAIGAVSAVLLAWFGYLVGQAHMQEQTIASLRAQGIFITYDYEFDREGNYHFDAKPRIPNWLLELLGRDFFYSPECVTFPHGTHSDTFTEVMNHWPNAVLEELGPDEND